MVERFLGVEEAVGSNPVVPTIFLFSIAVRQIGQSFSGNGIGIGIGREMRCSTYHKEEVLL